VIIERWLPYGPQGKRRTIVQRAGAAKGYGRPRNVIIQYEAPQVNVSRQVQRLGVTPQDPQAYVQQYGGSLLDAGSLLAQARAAGVNEDISPPAGSVGYAGGASFGGDAGYAGGASFGGDAGYAGGASFDAGASYAGGASFGGDAGYAGGASIGGDAGYAGGASFGGDAGYAGGATVGGDAGWSGGASVGGGCACP